MNSYPSAWGTGFSLTPEREHMDAKEATAFFVSVARRIHGDRFDYSRVVIPGGSIKIAMSRPVEILEHGEAFTVMPWTHILSESGR